MNIGDTFYRLTVVGFEGVRNGKVKVRCVCGNEKLVLRAHIKSGNTKSCGCLSKDCSSARFRVHGEVKHIEGKRVASPEYRTWQNMRNRCLNTEAQDYKYYGGRGIKVSPEWDSFEKFLTDMGRRPSSAYTLDRIDGNGDYSKVNCRWETRQTQARNRDYAKTKSWELAERLKVKPMTAHHYIWQVRAKDKGITKGVNITGAREIEVRKFIQEKGI